MSLQQQDKLLSFLESVQARPKKSLSQNFLQDQTIVEKILNHANLQQLPILEIGPGPGIITEALLKRNCPVIAVETDKKLAHHLKRFKNSEQKLEIFCENFLTFDLTRLPSPVQIVANLPYHLTAPILQKICENHFLFTSATLMVQKEVALRICSKPGSKTYGRLSVFTQFFSNPRLGFFVPNHCFYPKPRVDSAVIQLEFKEPPQVDSISFFNMVKLSFHMKRKKLTNNLKLVYPIEHILHALKILKINSNARAEDISLSQFLQLFDRLSLKM